MRSREIVAPRVANPHGDYPHARLHGDLLFLSGVGPRELDSSFAPAFDSQCVKLLDNVEAVLEQARTELPADSRIELVDVTTYLADPSDREAFAERYAKCLGQSSPLPRVVEVALLPGGISVELKIVARTTGAGAVDPGSSELIPLIRGSGWRGLPARQSEQLVYVSAEAPRPVDDSEEAFRGCCDRMFDDLASQLAQHGASLDGVLDVLIFLGDFDAHWKIYNQTYRGRFSLGQRPTRTTVQPASLVPVAQIKAAAWRER